MPFSVILRG